MVWWLRVGIAYLCFALIALGLIQYLARVEASPLYSLQSDDGRYHLSVKADVWIPPFFGRRGKSPGEVEIVDRDGRLIDSAHIDDVETIGDVHWERYRVTFRYVQDGETDATALDLAQ
ncbi:MAG TPA: hypothetical protein VGF86_05370 [Candidatus Tumulicola sp.]